MSRQQPFIIYPAIDLLDGQAVRLRQGRYDDVTVYDKDPVALACRFRAAGAEYLHVVDLNAARDGVRAHDHLIGAIARESGLRIQTGGGVRTMAAVESLLDTPGIWRVIIGTSAVRDPAFTRAAIRYAPDRVVIGLDARNGWVSVDGWTQDSQVSVLDLAQAMKEAGAQTIIYTDISRDGMMVGTAVDGISELVRNTGLSIIASGGIASMADIEAAKAAGASGAIVGKAIYEGKVRLESCWPKE